MYYVGIWYTVLEVGVWVLLIKGVSYFGPRYNITRKKDTLQKCNTDRNGEKKYKKTCLIFENYTKFHVTLQEKIKNKNITNK